MASIPSETIEHIAAANDIVEVIGAYFPLKRAGTNFKALCPFHQEKTPSFTVSPQRQTFHCFGCGVGGSVFRFVMEYEHVDFPSAVRKLAARVNIPVVEERGASASEDRQYETRRTLLRLHAEAAEWFHDNLLKKQLATSAREYLKKRGIPIEIAKRWQLGYAPDEWNAFGTWAKERGYRESELLASGLVKTKDDAEPDPSPDAKQKSAYDRFRGRLMFPICNDVGEVIAFSGRILQNEKEGAKYLNSPETPLFRKGKVLFGLHKTKRPLIEANCAIVCEGQLDLITLFEAGITNVVASQGTAFTENQARVLKRYVNEVILCFDADAAGQKAAERSLDALLQNDLIVRVAEMPPGEDPDSLIRRKGKEEFEKRIAGARDFFDYWIDREATSANLASLSEKLGVARRIAEVIGRIRDQNARHEISVRAASRLAVPTKDFLALIPAAKSSGPTFMERIDTNAHSWRKIDFLCLLALSNRNCRDYLLSQNWREVAETNPDMEPLERILEADFDPSDPASVSAFIASLAPGEDTFMAKHLTRKVPANAEEVAVSWWNGLRHEALERKLRSAESMLNAPGLSTGEVVNLQKQILDFQKELHELPRLSSAHKIDS